MTGFEDRYFSTEDGRKLHYRDYPMAAPGTVSGPPVLCLHALTRNCRDFEVLAPLLQSWGHRVLCPDQRGRGLSDYDPDPDNYVPPRYAQDMLGLLAHEKLDRVILIGTSLGGILTMTIAATQPDRVAGAVLNDIGPVLEPAGIKRIQSYLGKAQPVDSWAAAAEAARAVNGQAFPDFTPDDWLAFAKRTFTEKDGKIVADYDPRIARAFNTLEPPLQDMWPLFEAMPDEVPTLVLRGALSDILSPGTVAEMKARKPGLRTLEVPGRGHAPMLDEPACLAEIKALLEKIKA